MSTNLKDQPSASVKQAIPQRLHHNARVVKDHEKTRRFYEDVIGMPLLATWAEVGQFPEFPERPISYCHTFYGLSDGGALAFFGFAEPDVYEAFKAKTQSGFNHLALAVSPELQDQIKQKLEKAGYKTIFIDHGYCQSLYVSDPDQLTLEFTSDPKNAAEIGEWQTKTAHATLTRWLAGDRKPNNDLRHR
jgi:catechol 2,3-dioxygenase-like lactoylglutathione lyase family enzyme